MPISSLRITDFRNLASVEITPVDGINIIYGQNGSGKTSILESIYCLALNRSFRSTTPARLIRHSAAQFSLFAQIISENELLIPVGYERNLAGEARLKMAEQTLAQITELIHCLPVRIINSQSHQLFESGPNFRRKYLDWGLFYYSDQFLSCWRQFVRTLKQRNAVLRHSRSKHELDAWTAELVKHSLALDTMRRDYVEQLIPHILLTTEELLSISNLKISYHSGWDSKADYAEILRENLEEDCRFGRTQYGPHRADLSLSIHRVSAKHFLSRGQQKLLICAMILAQGMLLEKYANKRLLYLVDDLPSELDSVSRDRLIELLVKQRTQVFITAIESNFICDFIKNLATTMKVFHVEHGTVVESRIS